MNQPRYLTIAQLAKRFSISHGTARKWAEEQLGIIRICGAIRVPLAAVEEKEKEAQPQNA